jgi:hypothetical protein
MTSLPGVSCQHRLVQASCFVCFASIRFSARRSFSVFCAGFFAGDFGFGVPFMVFLPFGLARWGAIDVAPAERIGDAQIVAQSPAALGSTPPPVAPSGAPGMIGA